MEWFGEFTGIGALPIPNVLQFGIGTGLLEFVGLLVAFVPVLLAARDALINRGAGFEAPRLRVIEGRKELKPRAA